MNMFWKKKFFNNFRYNWGYKFCIATMFHGIVYNDVSRSCFCFQCCSFCYQYRKNPKISNTREFSVITLKVEQDGFSLE